MSAMLITKQTVAEKIAAYLRHEISLAQLVDWAELALMEGELSERDPVTVRDALARLGVADVRAFGLTWEDSEQLLRQLGFATRVDLVSA
jgi:cobyrinic acid a,c-diamide synthase